MSTYDENLRNTIIVALRDQELYIKQQRSQQNAALFTLFYAQGAAVTAAGKLLDAHGAQQEKGNIMRHAAGSSGISGNQLAAATQADSCVKHSVTNSAVCAANVQVAANAIVKLASDMGSMYSILQATDFDSDIYAIAHTAYDCVNTTAQMAEEVSVMAIQTCADIAKVPASYVAEKSKNINDSMTKMLESISAEYEHAARLLHEDNNALAAAGKAAKIAEGTFNELTSAYAVDLSAYETINDVLNLDLKVVVGSVIKNGYPELTVSFNPITSPFSQMNSNEAAAKADVYKFDKKQKPDKGNYPVSAYYIIFVKDTEKYTFSIDKASEIISDTNEGAHHRYYPVIASYDPTSPQPSIISTITVGAERDKHFYSSCLDSDGDPIEMGRNYVVFIMAVFSDTYKKMLNNFGDFLSAPSPAFTMAYHLQAATHISISKDHRTISFKCAEATPLPDGDKSIAPAISHRVMLLPQDANNSHELPFIFNVTLAEQIIPGNDMTALAAKSYSCSYTIDGSTTDIFGHPLSNHVTYLPAVLTICDTPACAPAYISALSEINDLKPFTLQ